MMKNKVTLGQLLDLIDKTRSTEAETIQIMEEGTVVCKALVCWKDWKYLEHRIVDCIQADSDDVISVWLETEFPKDCYHCKFYVEEHDACTFGEGSDITKDMLDVGCDCWKAFDSES